MTRRAALRTAAAIVIAALTMGSALLFTGKFGLVIAVDCLAGLGLVIALAAVPRGARDLPARRPHRAWAWPRRLRFPRRQAVPAPGLQTADFPTYVKISSDLSWAPVSQWHFDHGIRPLLVRLTQSALTEHYRVDAVADPARACDLVGDEIWPLVDPSRPPSFDSKAPGADLRTLAHIVDRLERL